MRLIAIDIKGEVLCGHGVWLQPRYIKGSIPFFPSKEKEMFDDILGKPKTCMVCKFCGKTLFVRRRKLDIEYYICHECYQGEENV